MFGLRTIREGQRVAVWDRAGRVQYIDGPKWLVTLGKTVEWLTRYHAEPGEYLAIRYLDGRVEHKVGPIAIWQDPVQHEEVEVHKCVNVDCHEAIVVYQRDGDAVTRRVERGPLQYMPAPEEWLHNFRWHGADPKKPDRKIPRALQFSKLRVIPDQMYFDVDEVRTADDALLQVKLMVFFELVDIERMLDQTHDPIADFINALTADIIDFAATLPFEGFKEQTARLNEMETYRQLAQRGERIGYRIHKVVYRGYHANDNLQQMHDHAIEARTELKLQAETERTAQELADMKLRAEAERAARRHEMETADAEHKTELQRRAHAEEMRQKAEEMDADLAATEKRNALELDRVRKDNAEQAAFLGQMQEMQVDLTKYLVAQYRNPDRLIRIDGEALPQMHLHGN